MFHRGVLGSLYHPVIIAAGTTTWNPSDKSVNITLSPGNLIATDTSSSPYSGIRAIASASSGKKYWEITVGSIAVEGSIGAGNSTAGITTGSKLGVDANSIGWSFDHNVYGSGGFVDSLGAYTAGDVICMAIDLGNNTIWFRKNGGNWNGNVLNNPATNTGGYDISTITGPFFAMFDAQTGGDNVTANFGATAYAQTPPSGFGNW